MQSRLEAQQRLAEGVLEVFKARDVLVHAIALREVQTEQFAAARRAFQMGSAAAPEVRETELDLRQQVLAEIANGPGADAAAARRRAGGAALAARRRRAGLAVPR